MGRTRAKFSLRGSTLEALVDVKRGTRNLAPAVHLALLLLLSAACATTAPRRSPLDLAVEAAARRCVCRIGVAARHLESGAAYEYNGDSEFESASVIKIAIVTEVMAQRSEGKIDLGERWTLTQDDKADGSGMLLMMDPGLSPTWNDLVTLMLGLSDNTATNAWIRRLTIPAVNARMESLGFHRIRLLAAIPSLASSHGGASPWTNFRLGTLTPHETGDWMARVAEGRLLDAESSRRVFAYLDNDPTRMRIARRFPSEDMWAGKSGTMRGVRNDAGILRTRKGRFVLVVLTDGSTVQNPSGADHPSVLAIADVARAIYDSWAKGLPDLVEKPK
jgi:beta-lactamase class A